MKIIIILSFISACSSLLGQRMGQKGGIWMFSNGVEFRQWYLEEFKENNFKKIATYIFKIKDNVQQKDSVLLYQQEANFDSLMVIGVKLTGDDYENATWDKCKTYFNKNGLMVRHVESPLAIESKHKNGSLVLYNPIDEYIFEYDKSNLLIKEIYNDFSYTYTISKEGQDTGILIMFHPEIDEYVYNDVGQKIKRYHTDDSTRYLPTNIQHYASWCSYCDPRYLNMEWFYNNNGLLEKQINYTRKGEYHTKEYFYYDKQDRVIKEIDSTGWYYPPASLDRYKTYDYFDSTKVKTEFRGSNNQDTYEISTYRLDGKELSDCWHYKDTTECSYYNYKFANNKLVYELFSRNLGYKMERYFSYNMAGMLVEKKVMMNGKLHTLIKYYYK